MWMNIHCAIAVMIVWNWTVNNMRMDEIQLANKKVKVWKCQRITTHGILKADFFNILAPSFIHSWHESFDCGHLFDPFQPEIQSKNSKWKINPLSCSIFRWKKKWPRDDDGKINNHWLFFMSWKRLFYLQQRHYNNNYYQ